MPATQSRINDFVLKIATVNGTGSASATNAAVSARKLRIATRPAIENARLPGNRRATMQRFATPRVVYSEDQIEALEVPTLVMWGEEDALIPLAAGEWYAEHLPNNTFVAYPEIGHIPQVLENAAP